MKQALSYARFSPRPDADISKSNERQFERCRDYCVKMGYELIGEFQDKDVSGKTLYRRGLSEALSVLKPGMILVIDRNDRLARDMLVGLTILRQVEARGATIEFADGSPLRTTPEGRLFQNILSSFAEFERERFARRTKAGLAKKKAAGQWLGQPPVGFRRRNKNLIRDEQEQAGIEIAISFANRGMSSDDIAVHLTDQIGPFRGRPWSARTVRKIIASAAKQGSAEK